MGQAIGVAIYKHVEHADVDVNWGSAAEARKDMKGVEVLLRLRQVRDHIKTFRPHYLVLTGEPRERMQLVCTASMW